MDGMYRFRFKSPKFLNGLEKLWISTFFSVEGGLMIEVPAILAEYEGQPFSQFQVDRQYWSEPGKLRRVPSKA